MRWLAAVVVLVTLGALAASAAASPKVAVVPIEGDASSGQLTGVVATEAAQHAKVTDAGQVEKALHALAIDAIPDARETKKLRARLEVDVIVTGKVSKDGKRLRLTLTTIGRRGASETFDLRFTKSSAKSFRTALAAALQEHVASVTGTGGADEDADEEPKPKPIKVAEEDRPVRHTPTKPAPVARRDDDDDDGGHVRRRRHRALDEAPVHPLTQGAIFLDAGALGLRRTLDYAATGRGTPPPPVGTAAATLQVEGAYYLNPGASFGVVGTVRQAVGVAITVPGTTLSCPIDEALYTVGVRYRFVFGGDSSLAIGGNYWRYRYLANRDKLGGSPGSLDMPDVDYSAFAPAADLKYALSPTMAAFGSLMVPIVTSSGPVTQTFGGAGGVGVALDAGLDVALAPHYGLRFAAVFDQVALSFDQTQTVAMTRGLTAATDRSIGVAATFALVY